MKKNNFKLLINSPQNIYKKICSQCPLKIKVPSDYIVVIYYLHIFVKVTKKN